MLISHSLFGKAYSCLIHEQAALSNKPRNRHETGSDETQAGNKQSTLDMAVVWSGEQESSWQCEPENNKEQLKQRRKNLLWNWVFSQVPPMIKNKSQKSEDSSLQEIPELNSCWKIFWH